MGLPPLTREQAMEAIRAIEKHGTQVEAAYSLGISRSTLKSRLDVAKTVHKLEPNLPPKQLKAPGKATKKPRAIPEEERGFKVKSETNQVTIWSLGDEVRTIEDALEKAEIDLDVWELKEATANQYTVPMKLYQVDGDKRTDDEPHREVLWQIKIVVRRRVVKFITDALEEIHERAKSHAPTYKFPKIAKISDPHLYEVSLFDHHFGKLCWAKETGNNFDLAIAENIYLTAIRELLSRAASYPIERFLFPIGQDFVHIDNVAGTTTAGTPQDTDGRYAKIVETAFVAMQQAVELMANIAPVDVILVMGNHDKHVSYHLARELSAWYHTAPKRVTVDYEFRTRKFYEYGKTLLGFAHGNIVRNKWKALPTLMATEQKAAWARTEHHEWHLGHEHHKAKHETLPVEEEHGVIMRTLPSLTGLDAWHYESGYYSQRAAEAYLWSKKNGYSGHFAVNAKEK